MSRSSPRRIVHLGLLVIVIFTFLGADQDARFQTLGLKIKCICGGCNQALVACNHVGCSYSDRMRAELASAVDRGDSDDLTLQAFVQEYGPTVLIAPTATGFNRVAWIMPYLALMLGITTVVLIVRTWRMRPPVLSAAGTTPVSGPGLEPFREQARRDTEV